jgi:hypothetical protein
VIVGGDSIPNTAEKCTLIDQKRPNFCFRYFPQISTLMEIPQGNTMENSGKQNPKMGFTSPPEQRRKSGAQQFAAVFATC